MLLRSCLAVPAVLFMLGTAYAATEECPAKSTQMDDIIAVLEKAPSCNRAMKIFEACEYGASGDVQFGAVVEKKCEADFRSGSRARRSGRISTRCRSATASTGMNPAPCTSRLRRSAGRRSPSAIRRRR